MPRRRLIEGRKQMGERVLIAGVGMVPFVAPGANASGLARRVIATVLADAGVDADLVEQAVVSRVHGDPGEVGPALARAGLTGIAVTNVSCGSVSGSAALLHARQALLSREAQCVLAVGFEDTPDPSQGERVRRCAERLDRIAARMGMSDESFARVAVKARAHAARNTYARHRAPLSLEEALAALRLARGRRPAFVGEASCGAAAVLLCTARFAAAHGLRDDVVLAAQALESNGGADGYDTDDGLAHATTRCVAERAFESAGLDPADVDVAEVHDCCVGAELIACAALGFCATDELERFVGAGANTYGGQVVVSPSGGVLSLGEAAGAIGLAQICELTWQLRGEAGPRQVPGARIALQHNAECGGAVAVAILRRS